MAGGAYSAHRWSSYRHYLHREMIYITFRCQGRSVLKLAFNLGSLVDPLVLEYGSDRIAMVLGGKGIGLVIAFEVLLLTLELFDWNRFNLLGVY